jgi:hypothetical protein
MVGFATLILKSDRNEPHVNQQILTHCSVFCHEQCDDNII